MSKDSVSSASIISTTNSLGPKQIKLVGWVERISKRIRAQKEDFRCFILPENTGNMSETQHFICRIN